MYTYKMYAQECDTCEYKICFTQGDFMQYVDRYYECEEIRETLEAITVESEYELSRDFMKMNSGDIFAYLRDDGIWQTMPSDTECSWYYDQRYDINNGNSTRKIGRLYQQEVFPVKLPLNEWLYSGDRGLYARFIMHPERDGPNGGKYYFPNKKCEHLCEGPVVITGVLDKGNFGFIECHMQQFEIPDVESLLPWLLDTADVVPHGTVQRVRTPFGELLTISDKNNVIRFIPVVCSESESEFHIEIRNRGDITDIIGDLPDTEREVLETCGIKDYICRLGVEKTELEIQKMFRTCGFQFPDKFDDTVKETDPLMNEVLSLGIIRRSKVGTNSFYEVDFDRVFEIAAQFTADELDAIAATVNNLNDKTNKNITSQLKSGKLRLSL